MNSVGERLLENVECEFVQVFKLIQVDTSRYITYIGKSEVEKGFIDKRS